VDHRDHRHADTILSRTSPLDRAREAEKMSTSRKRGVCRGLGASVSMAAVALGLATAGCGDDASQTGADKADSPTVAAARESIKQQAKVRGKTLPADTNLSARERRALKQQGELPK